MDTPSIVLVSGSLRADSTSDRVARWCARQCRQQGAEARVFTGAELQFPFYRPGLSEQDGEDGEIGGFVRALSRADGLVLVSPTYHGTVSGLLKNALDYANELVSPRMFLEGVPLGCVAVGAGPQGMASTLTTLRTIGHALRAWPTPLGVTARNWTDDGAVPADGTSAEQQQSRDQMAVMIAQVLSMASVNAASARQRLSASRG
ncbi:NADPH-dependent FMN reductase [Streptomyces olivaceus]|uniref:NADPH-dependent FMN reductase n=1 Tax=Streptomyces olivaceus TaxID=47716 RepID=UPI001CCFA0F5|nr:NAD(P)H-dependent oxidoreductase [Streptomyces olivaceus]MBZ6295924.1 NAD(P)H-dependent oxidoreductase [Streptomyces olivaceus]MBZ6330902.1 NAD(P)H-dependent oxidoreductase [Streptomyces olivaceus]